MEQPGIIMEYKTDKINGMLGMYEKKFAKIKDNEIKYFEIGVHNGGSLLWASDYFSHKDSKIYGIDINIETQESGRVSTFFCNQDDTVKLQGLGRVYGKFDIIIDDGCHFAKETKNCFENLWQYLKSGGWYIIEDWSACYSDIKCESMDKVIAEILLDAKNYGITEIEIICGAEEGTYAIFRKK